MKLLVTRKDGSNEELNIAMPVTFSAHDRSECTMWQMHDAQGTDYFFNKEDGTYDGWGRAVSCNSEAEQLLAQARTGLHPPTPQKVN